ncbi:hypothetical protein OPQ81_011109 [Rhizoctonia solani]|nr:hypothetical protein OPQ81_011109 [Rhizoctonia solani]
MSEHEVLSRSDPAACAQAAEHAGITPTALCEFLKGDLLWLPLVLHPATLGLTSWNQVLDFLQEVKRGFGTLDQCPVNNEYCHVFHHPRRTQWDSTDHMLEKAICSHSFNNTACLGSPSIPPDDNQACLATCGPSKPSLAGVLQLDCVVSSAEPQDGAQEADVVSLGGCAIKALGKVDFHALVNVLVCHQVVLRAILGNGK